MEGKVFVKKTDLRNKIAKYCNMVKDSGARIYISDRGKFEYALVSTKLLDTSTQKKGKRLIEKTPAFGIFKNTKKSSSYVRKLRTEEFNKIYGGK